ncbi:MAG: hypothetical protein WCX32_04505 [Clostridia bacterium]|jgi:hypothetical protein|nr:hypothetical protein [Clostridia bacterium]MDD4275819.1 hypothetical protein [Clostridia bacterium]
MKEAKLEFAGSVYSIYLGIHQNESVDDYETRLDKETNVLLDELILSLNNIYVDLDEKLTKNEISYEEYENQAFKLKDEIESKFSKLILDCVKDCNNEQAKIDQEITK